jgi:hypothetical protein
VQALRRLSRTLVAAVTGPLIRAGALCLALVGGDAGVGLVAARAGDGIALVVRAAANGSARCFEVEALRQRIAYYGKARLARADELQLELYVDAVDSAELRVYRGRELLARRRFDHLPDSCADRRDTVALSIALALEGVLHELSPADVTTTGDTAVTTGEGGAIDARDPPAPPLRAAAEPRDEADRSSDNAARTAPEPVDRAAIAVPLPAEEEPARETAEAQDPEPIQDTAPSSGARAAPPFVHLHVGGRWLAHALPTPVWTIALGAELWLSRQFAVDMSAIASTIGNSTLAGARAESSLAGGELLGCGALGFDDFAAQGCVGASMAACRATGLDYPHPFPAATLLWAATTARLALRWPEKSWISLRVIVQGHVNLVRPELRVDGSRERLYPFWLGGSGGLDVIASLE